MLKTKIEGFDEVQEMLKEYRDGGALELKKYRAIGTVEECREAMERQRAKKPEFVRVADKNKNQYLCPYCKTGMYHYSDEERKWMNNRFCPKCGQAIDWSDTD